MSEEGDFVLGENGLNYGKIEYYGRVFDYRFYKSLW